MVYSYRKPSTKMILTTCITMWLSLPIITVQGQGEVSTSYNTVPIHVTASKAQEEARLSSQSTTIITKEDIERKQAKALEDVIFSETGVTRTIDSMGNVGIAIRGSEPRHTLILVDGTPVLGDVSKYRGGSDEALRIGAENIERIEIIRGAASSRFGPDAIGGVINIITKAPSKVPSFKLVAEGRHHNLEGTDANRNTLPSNFYLRTDSGQAGPVKVAIFGSKRTVLPVYSSVLSYTNDVERLKAGKATGFWTEDFKPSLRYYGDIKNIGGQVHVDLNKNNAIEFKVLHEREDVERRVKHETNVIGSLFEPMRIFSRQQDRSTYAVKYKGNNNSTNWQVDVNYGKLKTSDTALTTYYNSGHSSYIGNNSLVGIDWIEHNALDINASATTGVNEKHTLDYGFGISREKANGSRLKNAPHKWVQKIDPWDYDKNLYTLNKEKDNTPDSTIHDYIFNYNEDGTVDWNRNLEYYNSETAPPITYEEAVEFIGNSGIKLKTATGQFDPQMLYSYTKWGYMPSDTYRNALDEAYNNKEIPLDAYNRLLVAPSKWEAFTQALEAENPGYDTHYRDIVKLYFHLEDFGEETIWPVYNNNVFKEVYDTRKNLVSGGNASLKKWHAYVGDTWQLSNSTILLPTLRIDGSDKFGSHLTANLGLTHHMNNNPHRRFKFNVGSAYATPGLGELYYNWEMFGSAGGSQFGWYWVGNPRLKPEKSFNIDLSIEGESKHTFSRLSVFHNSIKDYMTPYFTGQLLNFGTYITGKGSLDADRVYTFRNIGKAEITGIEAEVQQKFNKNWSAKLGYAWIKAINKSDSSMPRRLLDRPQHKVDISLNYADEAHGWRGAVWGDYYINMLDSNSVQSNFTGNDYDAFTGKWKKKEFNYRSKTFGIWNLLVEKQFGRHMSAYIGIDNLFNHKDDDRAYQDRTYRIGATIQFGPDGHSKSNTNNTSELSATSHNKETKETYSQGNTETMTPNTMAQGSNLKGTNTSFAFIERPDILNRSVGDIDVHGDVRVRSNMYKGKETSGIRELVTYEKYYEYSRPKFKAIYGSSDEATQENMRNKARHGLDSRIRLGIDGQITPNTNVEVVGSTSIHDQHHAIEQERGIHDVDLEEAKITNQANHWDTTIGLMQEKMGATGYWFNDTFKGVRTVWTNGNQQVRLGVGDFRGSTGIVDSAYSHLEKGMFYRSPTFDEILNGLKDSTEDWNNQPINFKDKYLYADKGLTDPMEIADARLKVLIEFHKVVDKIALHADTPFYEGHNYYRNLYLKPRYSWLTDANFISRPKTGVPYEQWGETHTIESRFNTPIYGKVSGTNDIVLLSHHSYIQGDLDPSIHYDLAENTISYIDGDGDESSQFSNKIHQLRWHGYDIRLPNWEDILDHGFEHGKAKIYDFADSVIDAIKLNYSKHGKAIIFTDKDGNSISDQEIKDTIYKDIANHSLNVGTNSRGEVVRSLDTFGFLKYLEGNGGDYFSEDVPIPVEGLPKIIKTEGYVVKQDYIPSIDRAYFGQYRRLVNDNLGITAWHLRSFHRGYMVHGKELSIANVFGLGLQYKLGDSLVSFDWGVNRSEIGKYYQGGRNEYGHYVNGGSNPTFWVLRYDIGNADTTRPNSWNAFIDYKAFKHGSFFGGNGTQGLPDRYLDGIKSFTLGVGFVPWKHVLLEGFYTFGAKGLDTRDSLYGKEKFRLGDYTRIQATYRF